MLPNPLPRKLVQISEEALPAVHFPLILGNDIFVISQQDVRKLEDSRLFSMIKIMPNGDLKTISLLDNTGCALQLCQQENFLLHQNLNTLLELIKCKTDFYQACQQEVVSQQLQQCSPLNETSFPQPMEVSVADNAVATITQQLHWNKCDNQSKPFPIHYSVGTSTTEIDCNEETKDIASMNCSCCKMCQKCEKRKIYSNKSINTEDIEQLCNNTTNENLDAREQLKKKKIRFSFT